MRKPTPLLALIVCLWPACAGPVCPKDLVSGLRTDPNPSESTHLFTAEDGAHLPSPASVAALAFHLRSGTPERCYFDGMDATIHVHFPKLDHTRESFRRSLRGRVDRRVSETGETWILHALRDGERWFLNWGVPAP